MPEYKHELKTALENKKPTIQPIEEIILNDFSSIVLKNRAIEDEVNSFNSSHAYPMRKDMP